MVVFRASGMLLGYKKNEVLFRRYHTAYVCHGIPHKLTDFFVLVCLKQTHHNLTFIVQNEDEFPIIL